MVVRAKMEGKQKVRKENRNKNGKELLIDSLMVLFHSSGVP